MADEEDVAEISEPEITEEEQEVESDVEEDVPKEEVKMQYVLYVLLFLTIYYGSWLVPLISFLAYAIFFLKDRFLEIDSFLALFTDPFALLGLISIPLALIACYLIRLFFLGLLTRIFWRFTEKMLPTKPGVIPRNVRSRTADYYHLRSFMIKYGKNVFTKGAFPWLSNWYYNFVGSAKIEKGSTLEESVLNDRFYDVGKNCYVGVNSTLATHLLTGIFGNINYFPIKLGNNVTTSGMNQIGPGSEIKDNASLLPLASTSKHSFLGSSTYFGIPLRKIFKRKIMDYLQISKDALEVNEKLYQDLSKEEIKKIIKEFKAREYLDKVEKKEENSAEKEHELKNKGNDHPADEIDVSQLSEGDLAIDFATSSSIGKVNLKFLIVYLPIFWICGLLVAVAWFEFPGSIIDQPLNILWAPLFILAFLYMFIFSSLLFSKLFLTLVNLIHKPKEGIFPAEIGNKDYEFWKLRIEIKKIALWLIRNSPMPWLDVLVFKTFGLNMDMSSHLTDAWIDGEFINLGRLVGVGQGATVMSSMIFGKYLIIRRTILDDYSLVGGHTTIAPGTIIGKDTTIGALSSTSYNAILDPGKVYFGFPARYLKENRYAQEKRDVIIKRMVDDAVKAFDTHKVNIDEDKLDKIKTTEETKRKLKPRREKE